MQELDLLVPRLPLAVPVEPPVADNLRQVPPRLALPAQVRLRVVVVPATGRSANVAPRVAAAVEEEPVEVEAVASDHLAGVDVPTRVVVPEMWFDGWLRELEDLAYNVAFLFAALRTARRFQPDVIYQRHTAFNVSGAWLSRMLGLPLVLEFNSSEVWKGRHWGGLRLARAATFVERINLHAAQRIMVVSRVLRHQLLASGVPASKIMVNPNGVDSTIFRPDVDGQNV